MVWFPYNILNSKYKRIPKLLLISSNHHDPTYFNELKEFIENKFKSHEDLEALRFKRIDELITSFGKEIDSNEETVKRIHTRVDRIEQSIKVVRGMGTAIATVLGAAAAWLGMNKWKNYFLFFLV